MKLAVIGHGNVARALLALLRRKAAEHSFEVAGVHTRSNPAAANVDEFLNRCQADVLVELSTLNPATGEPASSHISAAFARGMHVVTANKGPIAHHYARLRDEARARLVGFRFEATVMDGAPVFNQVRKNLPGVRVTGFAGVLNSTSKLVIQAMEQGGTFESGVEEAQRMGVAEADASYDIDGWDSAAKTAALANVLLDARITPLDVQREGIRHVTPNLLKELNARGETIRLVSEAREDYYAVRCAVLKMGDTLAAVGGTSNLLLLHTDEMGTIGTLSIDPGVEQTAYGVYIDLMDLASA